MNKLEQKAKIRIIALAILIVLFILMHNMSLISGILLVLASIGLELFTSQNTSDNTENTERNE